MLVKHAFRQYRGRSLVLLFKDVVARLKEQHNVQPQQCRGPPGDKGHVCAAERTVVEGEGLSMPGALLLCLCESFGLSIVQFRRLSGDFAPLTTLCPLSLIPALPTPLSNFFCITPPFLRPQKYSV